MTTPLGIGVLSFAQGHASVYCQRMLSYQDVKLVACWDDHEQRGRANADKFGLCYSPHVEDVLNDSSIQMVLGAYQSAREGRRVTFPLI